MEIIEYGNNKVFKIDSSARKDDSLFYIHFYSRNRLRVTVSAQWLHLSFHQYFKECQHSDTFLTCASLLQVLKGHDDHVITCLQFCGNRIVSGSDDNTLKVWSAVTGKVRLLFSAFHKVTILSLSP